jgi:uncharacterized protein (TIGR03435 family)
MARSGAVWILVALSVCARLAAQQSKPTFEVVSVRAIPSSGERPSGYALNPRRTGDRLTWTTTVYDLTRYAYNLPAWRISGMEPEPAYITIAAQLDTRATLDDVRAMLRQLLIDRFKLVSHTRTEQRSGYALRVAKNGARVQPADGSIPPLPKHMGVRPPEPFEGFIFTSLGSGCGAITGRRVPMSRLADELSAELNTLVIDQTGLSGSYYFGFDFQQLVDCPRADVVNAPSLFEALEREMGLTLQKTTGPVEFLVVDSVEKVPTEN